MRNGQVIAKKKDENKPLMKLYKTTKYIFWLVAAYTCSKTANMERIVID